MGDGSKLPTVVIMDVEQYISADFVFDVHQARRRSLRSQLHSEDVGAVGCL
jgi:hypothetical protein